MYFSLILFLYFKISLIYVILGVDIGVIEFCEYYLSVEVTATVKYIWPF